MIVEREYFFRASLKVKTIFCARGSYGRFLCPVRYIPRKGEVIRVRSDEFLQVRAEDLDAFYNARAKTDEP